MKRLLFCTGFLLGALALSPAPVQAQGATQAQVVGTCGTASYTAGQNRNVTQDTTGLQCTSATGGGGGNVNLTGINGVAPQVGNGTTGTGTLRVTVSSDSTGTLTNPSIGANGSAVKTSSTLAGVSDGTNQQQVVAPIALGDGVNGNNMVSTGGWVWNGTTWDRMPGTAAGGVKTNAIIAGVAQGSATAGQTVQPIGCRTLTALPTDTTAQTNMPACTTSGELSTHDATLATLAAEGVGSTGSSVPAQAILMGGRAATANPTAVTNGQLVAPMMSVEGKPVVDLFAPSALRVGGSATSTDTSAHNIIAASGSASLKTYVTGVNCGRTDAATSPIVVTFNDAYATTMVIPDAGNGGGNNYVLNSPLVTAANTAFTMTSGTGVTTLYCTARGYLAP